MHERFINPFGNHLSLVSRCVWFVGDGVVGGSFIFQYDWDLGTVSSFVVRCGSDGDNGGDADSSKDCGNGEGADDDGDNRDGDGNSGGDSDGAVDADADSNKDCDNVEGADGGGGDGCMYV